MSSDWGQVQKMRPVRRQTPAMTGRRWWAVSGIVVGVALVCLLTYWFLGGFGGPDRSPLRDDVGRSPGAAGRRGRPQTSASLPPQETDISDPPVRDPVVEGTDMAFVEAVTLLPVSRWQKERIDNIRKEKLKNILENLANWDDDHFATTVSGGGFMLGDPRCEMTRLVHLSRVRRLLETGRETPEAITPKVKAILRQSLAGWPDAYDHEKKRVLQAKGFISFGDGPNAYEKARVKAMVATYLLAELQDHDALPLLMKSHALQAKWIAEWPHRGISSCPVPPAISLYAIHRLVSTYPQSKLGAEAREAHRAYMEWAKKQVRPPVKFKGTAWDAKRTESDPALRVLTATNRRLPALALRDERMMELVTYPTRFADGGPVQGGRRRSMNDISDRAKEWFVLMETFLAATQGP